jgi:hypothetical protein
MGRANIGKLMQTLTAARPVAPFESKITEFVIGHVERDGPGDFDDFMDICAHQCAAMIKHLTGETPHTQEAETTARRILNQNYPEGADAAYFEVEMGRPGGMRHVLDVICDALSREADERFFDRAMKDCVDAGDPNDVLAFVTQYLERYGQAVFGTAVPDPSSLASRIKDLLHDHITWITDMQEKYGATTATEPALSGDQVAERP